MDELNVSTTGLNVTLDDLGVTLTHPSTVNLLEESAWTDIIDSLELENALKSGALTAIDENGDPVFSSSIGGIYKEIQDAGSQVINTVIATGSINADASVNSIVGASVSSFGTGLYRVTFNSPLPNANYPILISFAAIAGNNDLDAKYENVLPGSFDIRVTLQDDGGGAGVATNAGFSFFIPETSGAFIGFTDHDELQGLGDDDHPQYALTDGSRGNFATTGQGALADTAVQPAQLVSIQNDITTIQGDINSLEAQDIAFQAQQTNQDGLISANTAKVSATGSIDTHSDVDVTTNPPNLNEVLGWDGSNFVPQVVVGSSSPWTTVTGGINYDGGNVGVDTDNPIHNIQVGEQLNDTQINPARIQDTEIAQYAGTADNNGTATLGLYESVPTGQGIYGARIRYEADVNILRFTTVTNSVEVEAFNWDRATQVATFFGDINAQANQAKNFADATDPQDLTTLNQFRLLTDVVKVRNNATGNLNTGPVVLNSFKTVDELGSTLGQFTFASNGITPLFTGAVRVDFNVELSGAATRATVGFRWSHNGSLGPWTRHTYIRNASGHNESSANFSTVIPVVSGQPIQIEHQNFAGGGTVTSIEDGIELVIQRVK